MPKKESSELVSYSWEEIQKHKDVNNRWVVIDNKIYDVTRWQYNHPGGARILGHYAGQEATDAWTAFHNDKELVGKYMKPLLVGQVAGEGMQRSFPKYTEKDNEMLTDYRKIRKLAEESGWFVTNPWFYLGQFGSLAVLEILATLIIYYYGWSWLPFTIAGILLATSQSQFGWLQHDFGHLSVFKNHFWDHFFHHVIIGACKGASSKWWNFRHFQHHSKPNIIRKDPDITLPLVFLIGDVMPVEWAKRRRGIMPYQWQHGYFFLLGPPLLLPIYFHYENLLFVFKRRLWLDLFSVGLFMLRFHLTYYPMMGLTGSIALYFFTRFLESHWFVWCTQMSHIPMEVDRDGEKNWFQMQLDATCNVRPSYFNDWFSGHLNFQIEHHLFPTMPRHNYHKVAPLIESLCKKHDVKYTSKPTMFKAFADIVGSLKRSGQLWYEAYHLI